MAIYSLACSTICHGQENRMQLKEVLATTPEVLNRHQTLSDSVLQERITQLQIVPYFGHSEATDNPRGVYKLTGLLDKYGNVIKEPFDQYKICTDSVTQWVNCGIHGVVEGSVSSTSVDRNVV